MVTRGYFLLCIIIIAPFRSELIVIYSKGVKQLDVPTEHLISSAQHSR